MALKKKHLVMRVAQLRKAIKTKYKAFKLGAVETERELEKQYKPLLAELKKEPSKILKEEAQELKQEKHEKEEHEDTEDEEDDEEEHEDTEDEEEEDMDHGSDGGLDVNDTAEFDPDDASTPHGSTPAGVSRFVQETYPNKLTRKYMKDMISDPGGSKMITDHTFGPRYDDDALMIGNKELTFDNDGSLLVAGIRFRPTVGLYELVFRRVPDSRLYDRKDLDAYKEILKKTSAHKKKYNPVATINRNNSTKYTKVIAALFPKEVKGSGWKSARTKDLKYWDDPNELCDRLRLLVASAQTGNKGHVNEMINIIEELKERKFISGEGNTRFKSLLK